MSARIPHFAGRPRTKFTTYNITSFMFSTPGYSTLMLYPNGSISLVTSTNSLPISRPQAAYILNQARAECFRCQIKRSILE
jgi:hypothetical protein